MRPMLVTALCVALAGCAGPHAAKRSMPADTADTRAQAAERPGLGTSWGERRHSRVQHVRFERCGPTPESAIAVNYDDAAGVQAMIDHDLDHGLRPNAFATGGGELTVSLVDESGRALPGLPIGDRTYVIGEAGARYEISISNRSARRYEVVASVDGLDVIDGGHASYDKRGYLVDPQTDIRIDGWRTSAHEVAAFRFGSVRDSYAARRGDDRNVGVIGLAFFCERGADRRDEVLRRKAADPFPGNYAPSP